jgi:hypothetical protein
LLGSTWVRKQIPTTDWTAISFRDGKRIYGTFVGSLSPAQVQKQLDDIMGIKEYQVEQTNVQVHVYRMPAQTFITYSELIDQGEYHD